MQRVRNPTEQDVAKMFLAQDALQNQKRPEKNDKNDLKARNRVAAKKWREKKNSSLSELELENDKLREQALDLRNQAVSLVAENTVLESELQYFQIFMTRIMNVTPQGRPPQ